MRNKLLVILLLISLLSPPLLSANTEGIQVYQKNVHLSPEHKQKIAQDIYRYYTADNIWDILRHEFILPNYENYPQVREQIAWFLNHQDFLFNTITRSAPYLYFILQQTHKRHLPTELVLLPIIESGYNPFAYSTMGAAGIWQMMPGTASGFGIKRDGWYDGRRDIVASTKAALDYLTYLGGFFEGNWLLAIAAYDTGEGNILSAIKRNIREGRNTDFWSLSLSQETRVYVPRLLALATIISNPEKYPIQIPQVRNAPYLAQIDIGAPIDLTHAAVLAGLSLKKIKQLNAGFNHTVTTPKGPFKLVLPIEHVERFSENLSHSPFSKKINWSHFKNSNYAETSVSEPVKKPEKQAQTSSAPPVAISPYTEESSVVAVNDTSASTQQDMKDLDVIAHAFDNFHGNYSLQPGDTLYMVRENDDIEKVAKRFHTNVKTLVAVNQLPDNPNLHTGDKLIIPTHLTSAPEKQEIQLTPGGTIYMVRKEDDIDKIAKKFHTTPLAIRVANLMADYTVQEGDRLVIPTHVG